MQTPAGKECQYFYGDYFRGRKQEECRLLNDNGLEWQPSMCKNCPVPNIFFANSCENMEFTPRLYRPYVIVGKSEVIVSTHCVKCECKVEEPAIGCGQCHPLLDTFVIGSDEIN